MDKRQWALLEEAREFLNQANEHYYRWVEHMLTISVGALTLLISFQDKFVPESPRLLWCLSGSWLCLALSIAAGAIIMHGRYKMMKHLGRKKIDVASEPPTGPSVEAVNVTGVLLYATIAFPWLLAVSLGLLALFAIVNVHSGT